MIPFEKTMLALLARSRAAMAAGDIVDAATLMRRARELSEQALRNPKLVSRGGLEQLRRQYQACTVAQPRR